MSCFEYGTIVELDARETMALPDARSATLRVTRGTVWITQEGDPQDVVLRTGDTWVVERDGLTVLEAQGDVSLCVVGRRIEALIAGRKQRSSARTVWSRTREVMVGFFASPTRGPVPYV